MIFYRLIIRQRKWFWKRIIRIRRL